jgi:hypothetical protein
MADQVDRANEIEGQSTDREVERIRVDSETSDDAADDGRPGEPHSEVEIQEWIKAQTSIRPKKPLPKP